MRKKSRNQAGERTRQAIKTAFAELVDEKKSLDKITVSALMMRAGISRGTFYNHYNNLRDVAEDFESEFLELLPDDKDLPLCDQENIDAYFDKVLNFVKANEATYRLLLSSATPNLTFGKLNRAICEKVYKALKLRSQRVEPKAKRSNFNFLRRNSKTNREHSGQLEVFRPSDADLRFVAAFFTDGMISQVVKYFTGEYQGQLEQIADYAKRLFGVMFAEA